MDGLFMPRSLRDIAIVILLIGGGLVILLSSPSGSNYGLATRGLYAIIRPFQQAIASVHRRVTEVRDRYIGLVEVSEENRALKEQIRELKHERAELINAESENRRLRKLLNLKSRHEFPTLMAQVIGEDAAGWYRTLFVNRGSDDGVSPFMPVTVAEGLVGRIMKTSTSSAQVLLLTDPSVSVDCRVARTRDRGVLVGSLDRACLLRYISLKSDVRPGDEVYTSGLDGIFPRGLAVGRVTSVGKGPQGLFLEAHVTPWVDFSGIEEVLVILGQGAGFDLQTGLEDNR
jgi:rod shape-determining protein MreC